MQTKRLMMLLLVIPVLLFAACGGPAPVSTPTPEATPTPPPQPRFIIQEMVPAEVYMIYVNGNAVNWDLDQYPTVLAEAFAEIGKKFHIKSIAPYTVKWNEGNQTVGYVLVVEPKN